MRVFDSKGKEMQLSKSLLNNGGEGTVYKIISPPCYFYSCVKIYHKSKRTSERESKLQYMIKNRPKIICNNNFLICWPIDLIYNKEGSFCGFIMPLAFNNSIELYELCRLKLSNRLDKVWHEKYQRNKSGILNRLKLMKNIAIPLHLIHQIKSYVIVDFKPQNILIDVTGRITIIDIDSIQIETNQHKIYRSQVSTPEYNPPEVKSYFGKFNISSDLFALSVIFYQILFGLHPFAVTPLPKIVSSNEICECIEKKLFPFGRNSKKIDVIPPPHNQFNNLPIELKRLFLLSFEEVTMRTTAEMWGRTLKKIIANIENRNGQ